MKEHIEKDAVIHNNLFIERLDKMDLQIEQLKTENEHLKNELAKHNS